MSQRRQLTKAEKQQLRRDKLTAEQAAHAGHTIHVAIEDWTDENGEPVFQVARIKTPR